MTVQVFTDDSVVRRRYDGREIDSGLSRLICHGSFTAPQLYEAVFQKNITSCADVKRLYGVLGRMAPN